MSAAAPILDVENLAVAYRTEAGDVPAIRDVSFALGRDEALGLVGESGSGKTTIGLAIVRHLAENGRIARGAIRFDGTDLVPLAGAALRRARGRRIAMVYQDPANALNPSLRIGPQIAEIYRRQGAAGGRELRDRAVAQLQRVHLPDAASAHDRYPHEFSGGQLQRIVIAMALAMNPDLLILDEPTTGLDVTVEAEILDLFSELRRSVHAGILFISHNIAVIARMCDRIGALYAGELVELGKTEAVLGDPRHPYTRALLAARIPFGTGKADTVLATGDAALLEAGRAGGGCAYAPPCAFAQPRCRGEAPPLVATAPGHASRCFFHATLPTWGAPPRRGGAPPPKQAATLLEVHGLEKRFRSGGRSVAAVAGAAFGLARGRVLGVVGESGSGKSTTARLIAGLLVPDAGSIALDGQDIARPVQRRDRATRRAVQMVFQHPDSTLNPAHRIGQILRRTAAKLTGASGAARHRLVEQALDAVRLERRHLDAYPEELSGGQRQRVAIARAFIGQPRLVLCDEPTSALDVSIQAAILNLLVELQGRADTAYLFISHDLAVIRYIADDVAVMYLGEIVEIGPAARVFQAPNHPYTESLLAAVLSLDRAKTRRRSGLGGPVPSPIDRPAGCPFHPRCPRKVGPACEQEPPWQEPAPGHRYRCVIAPAPLGEMQAFDRIHDRGPS